MNVPTTEVQKALRIYATRLSVPAPGLIDGQWGPKTARSWFAWMEYQAAQDQDAPVVHDNVLVGGRRVQVVETTEVLARRIYDTLREYRPSWWSRFFGKTFV